MVTSAIALPFKSPMGSLLATKNFLISCASGISGTPYRLSFPDCIPAAYTGLHSIYLLTI